MRFSEAASPLSQFALVDSPLQQKPGRRLHQPCRQPHAFRRIGERGKARQFLRLFTAVAIEIIGGFLDQRHAIAKQGFERFRRHQFGGEGNRGFLLVTRQLNHATPGPSLFPSRS